MELLVKIRGFLPIEWVKMRVKIHSTQGGAVFFACSSIEKCDINQHEKKNGY